MYDATETLYFTIPQEPRTFEWSAEELSQEAAKLNRRIRVAIESKR